MGILEKVKQVKESINEMLSELISQIENDSDFESYNLETLEEDLHFHIDNVIGDLFDEED